MYKTKSIELFNEHLDIKLYGKNIYSKGVLDLNLGFEINQHYISLDLIIVGIIIWRKV